MLIFRIALRNVFRHLWRNTLIIFSIKIVLIVLVLIQSQKKGTHTHIIQKNIFAYVGIAQISPKSQDKSLFYEDFIKKNKDFFPKNTIFSPRIMQWAWGNIRNIKKPINVLGISQKEEQFFKGVFKGVDFCGGKNGFLGENFKEKGIKINDTLWINTQNKLDFFIIKGFFLFSNPVLNENAVIIPLLDAQKLYNLENQCDFISIISNNKTEFSSNFVLKAKTNTQNQAKFLIWQEVMPDIAQMLWLDKAGFGVLMIILCLVLSLGLMGSVIILAQERKGEFVQLYELGVDIFFLKMWILIEWFFILIIGILIGILTLLPILFYLSKNPIVLQGEIARSLREIGFSAEIHFAFDLYIFFFPICIILFLGFILGIILKKLVI